MIEFSPYLTVTFQLLYSFFFLFIILNLFLIIVKNEFLSYEDKEFFEKKNDKKPWNNYKVHFLIKIKDFIKFKIIFKFLKAFHLKNLHFDKNIYKIESEFESESDMENYQNIDFDLNYSNMIKKIQSDFDSKYVIDSEKERINRNNKKKKAYLIWSLFGNLILFLVFILSYLYIYNIKEYHDLIEKIDQKFSNINEKFGNNDYLNLSTVKIAFFLLIFLIFMVLILIKVNTKENLLLYIGNIVPKVFSQVSLNITDFNKGNFYVNQNEKKIAKNYFIGHYFILVENSIRITMRKVKKKGIYQKFSIIFQIIP